MNDKPILGYLPIYAPEEGTITTRAFILCSDCNKAISPNGGPRYSAMCGECVVAYEVGKHEAAKLKEKNA
jgi:hypothetical protein